MKNGTVIKVDDIFVSKTADGSIITVGMEETEWCVRLGENLLMFKSLDSLIPDEEDEIDDELKQELFGLASMWFTDTNILFDKEYLESKRNITEEYLKRVKSRVGKVKGKEAEVIGSFFSEK